MIYMYSKDTNMFQHVPNLFQCFFKNILIFSKMVVNQLVASNWKKQGTLVVCFICVSLMGYAQLKVIHEEKPIELTPADAKMAIVVYKDGRHYFSFQNALSIYLDHRKILFKNKKDAKAFVTVVGKSFLLKEGEKNLVKFDEYVIKLTPGDDGVSMVVSEKGEKDSYFIITKQVYDEMNVL